jgi:hypothetical protein
LATQFSTGIDGCGARTQPLGPDVVTTYIDSARN